jgi:arylsulfatase A-like enzyme
MLDGANVVLVLVDTLRADHLGCYGYSEPTSPFLDQLARRAVAFENVTSASSQTIPSVVSLWSAVYPTVHGNQFFPKTGSYRVQKPRVQPVIPADIPLLAELFRGRGYRTAAVVTNPWMRQAYGFGRGFDEYHYLSGENDSKWALVNARAVNDLALELMNAWKEERFLFYLHYMDAHFPYISPEPYRSRFAASAGHQQPLQRMELVRALYDGAIRGVDDVIRELFVGLEALHLESSTLVVVAGDHGEEFGEHGGVGHGHALFQESIHTPLLFVHPVLTPKWIRMPVGLIDVLPTLLDLTGGGIQGGIDGVSLAPWVGGERPEPDGSTRFLYSEVGTVKAVRRGSYKLIRWSDGGHRHEAFDLAVDPNEQNPIDGMPQWRAELESALEQLETRQPQRLAPPADEAPNPAAAEALRALGYGE